MCEGPRPKEGAGRRRRGCGRAQGGTRLGCSGLQSVVRSLGFTPGKPLVDFEQGGDVIRFIFQICISMSMYSTFPTS